LQRIYIIRTLKPFIMMQLLPNLFREKPGRLRAAALILAITFNLLSSESSLAQNETGKTEIYGGMGYFSAGYQHPNLSALNKALTREGFGAVPENYITFGGGGHSIIKNVVIGGEGHSFSGKHTWTDRPGGPVETALDGGYGLFNIGYVVTAKKGLLVYPMLGIGGGGLTLDVSDAPQGATFENMLRNHQQGVKLENGGFLLNFQLAADYMMQGNEKGRGGLLVGIRGGYMLAPGQWDNWTWNDATIGDGPDASLSGPYVRLTFGAGGYGFGKK
jgi:hypothetical protein